MTQAHVIPVEITAKDSSDAAWANLRRNVAETQSLINNLTGALNGMGNQGVSSLRGLSSAVQALRNPYVMLAATVAVVGYQAFSTHEKMKELGKGAASVGASIAEIEGLRKSIKHISGDADNATEALKNLRRSVDLGGRGEGDLQRWFAANNLSATDVDGKMRSLQEIYRDIAKLIENAANETDRLDIATAAFGSKAGPDMVRVIMAGGDALDRMKSNDGVLDPIVAAARDFDRSWREIVNRVNDFIGSIRTGNGLMGKLYELSLQTMSVFGSKSAQMSLDIRKNPNASWMWGLGDQREIDAFYDKVMGRAERTNAPMSDDKGASSARTAYDMALNSISKHIAVTEADAKAVGMSAGAHERLRVEAQLLEAALRAGLDPATVKQSDDFIGLAARAEAAAAALAKARIANQIKFDRNTIFLSETDRQIAQALRDIYPDVAVAMTSVEAAQMRLNASMRETRDITADALKGFIADLRAGKTAAEALGNALDRIATKMIDKSIDMLINAAFGSSSGFLGLFGSLFGSADGNVFSAGNVVPFARGGVVTRPTLFPMAKGGVGLMGEAGAEAVMPLARDSQGRLGVQSSGGRAVQIVSNFSPTFINASPESEARMRVEMRRELAAQEARLKTSMVKSNLGYSL